MTALRVLSVWRWASPSRPREPGSISGTVRSPNGNGRSGVIVTAIGQQKWARTTSGSGWATPVLTNVDATLRPDDDGDGLSDTFEPTWCDAARHPSLPEHLELPEARAIETPRLTPRHGPS
jgi:hypothetical protein